MLATGSGMRASQFKRDIPSADVGVVVLGDLLVGLLGGLRASALDRLRNVVGGVLDGLHCEDWVGA